MSTATVELAAAHSVLRELIRLADQAPVLSAPGGRRHHTTLPGVQRHPAGSAIRRRDRADPHPASSGAVLPGQEY
ncbi:MAG: hypothetical protein ACRDRX_27115 [Pseudonocardiaceae bacterium]